MIAVVISLRLWPIHDCSGSIDLRPAYDHRMTPMTKTPIIAALLAVLATDVSAQSRSF
jgi:hypothetical protein